MQINDILARLGIESNNTGTSTGINKLSGKGPVISSYSPVNGKLIAQVESTDADGYESVMQQAQKAFQHWRSVPAPKRGDMVRQFGDALRANKEDLGALVSYEMGKS